MNRSFPDLLINSLAQPINPSIRSLPMIIKKMTRFILATALCFFVFFAAHPSASAAENQDAVKKKHTLTDLYNLALSQSERIRIAREDVFIAQKDKSRALSVLMPSVSAFGTVSTGRTDQSTDPTVPAEDYDISTHSVGWGVRFDQTFTLNGKELIALRMSGDNIERSNQDLSAVSESYLLNVATAYYQVLRARKGLEIAKANVQRLEKHRDSVGTRYKLDDVTKTDMARAQSELSDALARQIDDENRYMLSRAALESLVELPSAYELEEPSESAFENMPLDLSQLKREGLSLRPEIKSAELALTVAEQNVRLTQGNRWPTVSIEGQYAQGTDANDGTLGGSSLDYDKDVSGYTLAAKLNVILFDGGLRNAETEQAMARARQAKLTLSETRKKIELDVQDAFLNVSTQKSRLKALDDKLTYARQNYKAVSELYRHGLSNSVDMMDANTVLVSSERELSEARFGYKLAVLTLKHATGSFKETLDKPSPPENG